MALSSRVDREELVLSDSGGDEVLRYRPARTGGDI
jgi:hypothetical protein